MCLCVLVAGVTVFTFTGCGKKDDTLRFACYGYEYPVTYYDSNNHLAGIESDLGAVFGQKMNKKVTYDVMDWQSLFVAVDSGTHDLVVGLTITDDRKVNNDFTQPIADVGLMFIAKADDTSLDGKTAAEIEAAMNGKKVGTILGSAHDDYLETIPGITCVNYENTGLMAIALQAGLIDYFMWEYTMSEQTGKVIKDPTLFGTNPNIKLIETPMKVDQIGIMVKKGNTKLLNQLNDILTEIKADGKMEQIITKYV